jgi:glutathione S-transferase
VTLKLCGFATSNYYNKVKMQLMEKGVPFEEVLVWASQDEAYLARSPRGKVPYIEVDGRTLAESSAICEYVEESYPQQPLLPKDPFERAKVRELLVFLELHVELVTRRLYAEAFFGGKISDETKQQVEKELPRGLKASCSSRSSRRTSPVPSSRSPTAPRPSICRSSRWRPSASTGATSRSRTRRLRRTSGR